MAERMRVWLKRSVGIATAGGLLAMAAPFVGAAGSAPRLEIPVNHKDIGKVNAGEKTHVSFEVRNAGKAPLRILSVDGDCGCLTPHFPPSVPAGGKASIDATLEAEPMWSGKIEKALRVHTNDPTQAEVRLGVTATVTPFVQMDPASPVVLPYDHGKTYHPEIALTPRPGSKTTLGAPKVTDPTVHAQLVPPAAGDKTRTYHLKLTVGPIKRQGDFSVTVKMPTTERKMQEAWVVVTLLANSGPVVSPSQILAPSRSLADAARGLAEIQVFTRKGPMKLLKVEASDPALRTEIKATAPGHSYQVSVRTTAKAKPGHLKATLRVRTDDPGTPLIEVPVDAVLQ